MISQTQCFIIHFSGLILLGIVHLAIYTYRLKHSTLDTDYLKESLFFYMLMSLFWPLILLVSPLIILILGFFGMTEYLTEKIRGNNENKP